VEAGYTYQREGQTLEQVLFGEPSEKAKARVAKIKREEVKMTEKNSQHGSLEPDSSPQGAEESVEK
jgi:hypothetical protein